jgi:hypothetical protein
MEANMIELIQAVSNLLNVVSGFTVQGIAALALLLALLIICLFGYLFFVWSNVDKWINELKNLIYRYWGKAEKDGAGYHLLPFHCLDVAAVAAAWWDASPAIRHGFMLHNTLTEEQLRAWAIFFIALHDYGKYDVRFQLRSIQVWQKLYFNAGTYGTLPAIRDCKEYYHGERGLKWFTNDHGKCPVNVIIRRMV